MFRRRLTFAPAKVKAQRAGRSQNIGKAAALKADAGL
jgi:hypothetical protein